jgi:hypothetical protein
MNVTAERLATAWAKYVKFFGVPPHGTVKQLDALLSLAQKTCSRCECPVDENGTCGCNPTDA